MSDQHPSRMGRIPDSVTQPGSPPIFQTTAFDVPDLHVLADLHAGTSQGDIYTRDSNPNHTALATSIASLENAEAGCAFASGMGAIAAVAMTLASSGDHIIVSRSLYGITLKLMHRLQKQFGIDVTRVDAGDLTAVAEAVKPNTKFCMVETVSNPLLEVADIAGIVNVLPDSVPLVVDSTFTTPQLIKPLEHGAKIVLHSASKYLNGHGDVMLGVAVGNQQLIRKVRATSSVFGQNANPFESWLTQRGLRTLELRMRQICETTREIAEFLAEQPAIQKVYYPGLSVHRTHNTAAKLYPNGTGGIVTFELKGSGRQIVSDFMRAAESIPFTATLADARTTISHPASTSHGFMTKSDRLAMGITDELVRISIGLEPFEQLRDELRMALDSLTNQT